MKSIVITGASSGIGRACVKAFHEAGHSILAAGRNPDRTNGLGREHQGLLTWTGDLSTPEGCQSLADRAEEAFGGADVLVNAAGVIHRKPVEETSDQEWAETIAVNLNAVFYLSRAFLPLIRKRGGGAILNIASDWGLVGGARAAAYCASKGGVVLLSRAMARDHAAEGIRVNAICPGDVDTPMLSAEARQRGLSHEEALAEANAGCPMGRIPTAGEVAALAVFLASDAARPITGSTYVIDGGSTA